MTRYLICAAVAALAVLFGSTLPLPATSFGTVAQRAPQATYTEQEWMQFISAASLDGVLERCDDQKIHENKTHLKTTKRIRAAFGALAPQQLQQYMPAAQQGYRIGYIDGFYLPIVDGKPGSPVPVTDKPGCKSMEDVARTIFMAPGGILDIAGVDDGDGA